MKLALALALVVFACLSIPSLARADDLNITIDSQGVHVDADWPQYRFGPHHKGFNRFERILNPSNVSGLRVLWTANTGDEIVSSPAIVDGRVYIASQDGNLYAFRAKDGKPLWTQIVGGRVISSPAVAGGKVFIGSFISGANSALWVFDAITGSVVWQQPAGAQIFASPVTAHGVVYIGADDDRERAFKAATGMALWTQVVGFSLTSSAAVADGKVYVGADNEFLNTNFSAFKASDGTLV